MHSDTSGRHTWLPSGLQRCRIASRGRSSIVINPSYRGRSTSGKRVSLRCDGQSKAVLASKLSKANATILQDASEEDFNTEFLELIIAIKTFPGQPLLRKPLTLPWRISTRILQNTLMQFSLRQLRNLSAASERRGQRWGLLEHEY